MADDTSDKDSVGRRDFFKGAALGAAGLVVGSTGEAAPAPEASGTPVASGFSRTITPPSPADAEAEFGYAAQETPAVTTHATPGSDFMVDVLKKLDFEFVGVNPGSAFEGLHESIINYGQNQTPELLTCLHEEAAAAMAHGYAKAAGKPMLIMVHGTVGLLHSSMALFQAWADRVPVFVIAAHNRNPASIVNRPHSVQDMGSLVRDYVKFHDEATTLQRFADSAMRAYRFAMTPPMGPVMLTVDAQLQEAPIGDRSRLRIPALSLAAPPQGDANAVREAARLLVNADTPLIVSQKTGRTPRAWDLMLELADLLQAPVDVGTFGSWKAFPSSHPLHGTGGPGYTPDVTLGLEVSDMADAARAARADGRKTISITSELLFQGSNIHDFGRYADVDLAIAADAETTLPLLIEEIRRAMTPARKAAAAERGARVGAAHTRALAAALDQARHGWNSSPISVPRMIAELGEQLKHDDWAIGSGHQFTGDWQRRMLNFDKPYRYNGDCGGFGIGYDTPATVGVALANKKHGRLTVGIVGDGDLNFVGPGALWTAAHHQVPLLMVVHNNRAYHAEVMFIQRISGARGRGAGRAHIGNAISDPNIDYAAVAKAYGVYAEGPIEHPKDLAGAYQRALARVRAGQPALVDVVSQPR